MLKQGCAVRKIILQGALCSEPVKFRVPSKWLYKIMYMPFHCFSDEILPPSICLHHYRVFSLTWPASMQIYWNKRKRLHKKRVQLPEDWFGTPTWPPFHCFGTPILPPWCHVKTLNTYNYHLFSLFQSIFRWVEPPRGCSFDGLWAVPPSVHCGTFSFKQ